MASRSVMVMPFQAHSSSSNHRIFFCTLLDRRPKPVGTGQTPCDMSSRIRSFAAPVLHP
jgi:hypothetical protein